MALHRARISLSARLPGQAPPWATGRAGQPCPGQPGPGQPRPGQPEGRARECGTRPRYLAKLAIAGIAVALLELAARPARARGVPADVRVLLTIGGRRRVLSQARPVVAGRAVAELT
jgi:hypothetical protein